MSCPSVLIANSTKAFASSVMFSSIYTIMKGLATPYSADTTFSTVGATPPTRIGFTLSLMYVNDTYPIDRGFAATVD